MSSPIDFTAFNENKSATIQFSYPAVDNVQLLKDGSFFLPNNSVSPNFSYTDGTNNLYISGATIKGYILENSSKLVLQHQSVNSDKKFYVVIPLLKDKKASSSLSKLNSNSKVSIDLNSDIPTNRNIYHYMSSNDEHVFVFEKGISTSLSGISSTFIVPGANSQKYKITSNTKVEDEIVCGYSEDAETTPAKEEKITTTTSYSIAMFIINSLIIISSLQILLSYGENVKTAVFAFSGLFTLVLSFLIYLYRTKINHLIILGSLGVTFLIVTLLTFFSMNPSSYIGQWFDPKNKTISSSVTTSKGPDGLGFLKI
jgi:hypothetical protein